MKLGLCSVTFRSLSYEDVIRHAKAAGIEGIEWGECDNHVVLGDEARIIDIREKTKANGLEVFSLGAYCTMTDEDDWKQSLEAALLLETAVIRVWAGEIGSESCPKAEYDAIVRNTQKLADAAAEHGITIGFEFHPNTLADSAEAAIKLIKAIDRKNVGMYWQRNAEDVEGDLADIEALKPYMVKHFHINHYVPGEGYLLLEELGDKLEKYYVDFKDDDSYRVMIEFVKDENPENLIKDGATMLRVIK